jgi:glutamate-ammonia-ligase adenylyltransferase
MERLRQFAQGNMLRTAAADVTGVIPLMVVSDYLTEIAEVATARSLGHRLRDLIQRHGRRRAPRRSPGFLVLGYGKLGGIELGYNSDLDLVFLFDERCGAPAPPTAARRSRRQFYVRLAQRLIHIMTTPTYSGMLYEIDMRLRPDGNKGMIARSLKSFADYQANEAWTWEHQALVRARAVAGDPRLSERFGRARRRSCAASAIRTAARGGARHAREDARQPGQEGRRSTACFDLKQGRGGIADIEFMVQYSVLRWAAEHPDLTTGPTTSACSRPWTRLQLLPGEPPRT